MAEPYSETESLDERWPDILSPAYLDEFERVQSQPVTAVPTFLPSLNKVCGDDGGGIGLARGWFVLLAGNPGFGKTLGALLLARDSIRARQKTAIVSLETQHTQLAARLYALTTGLPVHQLERGRFDPVVMREVLRMLRALFPVGGLRTNSRLLYRLEDVMGECNDLADDGTTTILIDYLQLVGVGDEESINRQVTEAVTHLRRFAVERQVLVVVLSQFNRSTAGDYSRTPYIQGCHGGMIVEASADIALLLDHSRYEKDALDPHIARTYINVGKNRHGLREDLPVLWDYKTLTCREALPDEEHLWPAHVNSRR
jgi:replicative DNA helicase